MAGPVPSTKREGARPKATGSPRALGRALADFGDLSPAEKTLLDCCRMGKVAVISDKRPETETDANRVRAAFVRYLALDGDDENPVHERGIELIGAWVTGALDLDGAEVRRALFLERCVMESLSAYSAHLVHLALDGTLLTNGMTADRMVCDGGLFLRGGFHATGRVRLLGARIGGNLECDKGRFEKIGGIAFHADGVQVSGGFFLRHGFHATGQVCFIGATVRGDLDCEAGVFENGSDEALVFGRSAIGGDAWLPNVRCQGGISLLGATIGGDLICVGADLESEGGQALCCDRVRVEGMLALHSMKKIKGNIFLASMRVGTLWDDSSSWPSTGGKLDLDGFAYDRFGGRAPTSAAYRIAWLDSQVPEHLATEFRPQPWEQLVAVLRAMGHPEEARAVAIAKQDRLRRAKKVPRGTRAFHFLYGLLVGYGYRPMRLLAATASIWLLCALAYWMATNPAWLGAETRLLAPPRSEPGSAAARPDYRNFVPLVYSADVLLPVVDLGYKDEWQPVVADRAGNPLVWGQLLRFLYWFEIAFGWVAGLLLVGVLGNLIKKD